MNNPGIRIEPLCGDTDIECYAVGHVDKEEFAKAVIVELGLEADFHDLLEYVFHKWCVLEPANNPEDDDLFRVVREGEAESFKATILEF